MISYRNKEGMLALARFRDRFANSRFGTPVHVRDLLAGISGLKTACYAPLLLWIGFLLLDFENQSGILRICFFGIPTTTRIIFAVALAVTAIPLVNNLLWTEVSSLAHRRTGAHGVAPTSQSWFFDSRTTTVLVAFAFGALCWLFRDHNSFPGDQSYWSEYVLQDFSFHVRQPVATYYNRLVFLATGELFHDHPRSSIAFASCLLAVPFFYVSTRLVKELVTGRTARWLLLLFLLSSGATQLYFGHVETYTAFSTALLLYSLSAVRFLGGRGNLFLCALAYGMMCAVHLMGLFLGWSILFLVIFAMRDRSWREFFRSAAVALVGVLVPLLITVGLMATYMLFYRYDLRLETMLKLAHFDVNNTAVSLGGADGAMFKPKGYPGGVLSYWFSRQHGWEMLRLHLLIMPFSVFILPLSLAATPLLSKRSPDERAVLWFLLVLNLSYFQLTFLWAPDSGWYGDWSLFAGIGFTLNLMGGALFLRLERLSCVVQWIASLVIATGMARTIAWIATNHNLP